MSGTVTVMAGMTGRLVLRSRTPWVCGGAVLLALALRLMIEQVGSGSASAYADAAGVLVGIAAPSVALIVMMAALGEEWQSGAVVNLLVTPMSRAGFVVAKLLVAGTTVVATVGGMAAVLLVGGPLSGADALSWALAGVVAAALGCVLAGLFLVTTRKPAAWYMPLVVGMGMVAASFPAKLGYLSLADLAEAVAGVPEAVIDRGVAAVIVVAVGAVACWVTTRRVARPELRPTQ